MNNQKSIIGCGYIPRNVQAICLKSDANVKLDEVEYKIIRDPYERAFGYQEVCSMMRPRLQKRMAVNVLDANTGLAYAVEYEPANLVRPVAEPKTDQSREPVDFATRAGQIVDELKAVFEAGGGIFDKCGVAFFAVSDDGNDKTSTCVGFLGGKSRRVIEAIASACSKNPQALEIVKRASIGAMFYRILDGKDKEK